MDGPQYLWTRHTIRVSGIYNPKATSYIDQGNGTPIAGDGRNATTTDTAIRHALAQPRKALSISVGSQVLLASPRAGETTDAHNGPTPKVHAIVESIGIKTFLVDWQIEVCINETPSGTIPIVVSSRWTMEDHIALPHYLTTRVIQGWATLRSDKMLAAGRVPDDFRSALMHPVGTNMQRESIDVAVDDEGTGIEYTLVDQEQMLNIELRARLLGVTKIEAFHTAEVGKPGAEEVITGFGGAAMRFGGQLVQANMVGIDPITYGIAMGAAVVTGALDWSITAANLIPRKTHTIVARIWGHRLARRQDLEDVGIRLCFQRLLLTGVDESMGTVWLQITHDLMGKWVEVQVRIKQGLDALAAGPGFNITRTDPVTALTINAILAGLGPVQRDIMPQGEEIRQIATAANQPNPTPQNTGNLTGRGSFVGKLVAQVLIDANQLQTNPPTPTTGINTSIA
jgi:hypothetical protein